jgi:hypothetical protein
MPRTPIAPPAYRRSLGQAPVECAYRRLRWALRRPWCPGDSGGAGGTCPSITPPPTGDPQARLGPVPAPSSFPCAHAPCPPERVAEQPLLCTLRHCFALARVCNLPSAENDFPDELFGWEDVKDPSRHPNRGGIRAPSCRVPCPCLRHGAPSGAAGPCRQEAGAPLPCRALGAPRPHDHKQLTL